MQSSYYPRISTLTYQGGARPAPEQSAVVATSSDRCDTEAQKELLDLVGVLRQQDVEGIFSGELEAARSTDGTRARLEFPRNYRTLEASLASPSSTLDSFSTEVRLMGEAAVLQLHPYDAKLAQLASNLLSSANTGLSLIHKGSRAPTPALQPQQTAATSPLEEFWDPSLKQLDGLLLMEALRTGLSTMPVNGWEEEGPAFPSSGPRLTGVKRKSKVLDDEQVDAGILQSLLPRELQIHLAALIESVAVGQSPDVSLKGALCDMAFKGVGLFARACKTQGEKLRNSHSAEACRVLDFDFAAVCGQLQTGTYDDVQAVCEDVANVARAAVERASEEQGGMRKGKLGAMADQFAKALCYTMEEVVGQHHARLAPSAPQPTQPAPVRLVLLPDCMQANREPYLGRDWRKEPYAPRPYVRLSQYELKEDSSILAWKLTTEKRGQCNGDHCTTREGLGEYKMDMEAFETQCSCLSKNLECGPLCGCETTGRCLNRAVTNRQALRVGIDVQEVNSWGMDCYTRRNIQDAILESEAYGKYNKPDYAAKKTQANQNPLQMGETIHHDSTPPATPGRGNGSVSDGSPQEAHQLVVEWLERTLLPAINRQGNAGWDILLAIDDVRKRATRAGDERCLKAVRFLEARIRKVGQEFFRIHPKGVGMVCMREGGLPRLTFVEEYLGEVHPPWRWFEMQDAIKKATNDELPDFYNIVLERPRDDPAGYDVLFVDAASKGAFASRMSHSCTPNCQAVVMACGGRLTIAVYTLRHVNEGEELTFDYASVTESEKEFRDAICLCSTPRCRGSFLYFAGSRAFQQVLNEQHTVLHRQALLLQACMDPLNPNDEKRLADWALRESVLGCKGGADRAPAWLEKWAALVLEFIEQERRQLPDQLCALQLPYAAYTRSAAEVEAKGIADNRVQNVAITLDKIKLCLRRPGQIKVAPLRRISDEDAMEHLWSGPKAIARRLLRSAAPLLGSSQFAGHLDKAKTADDILALLESFPGTPSLDRLARLVAEPAVSFQDAKEKLMQVVALLREFDLEMGGGHTAAADILTLYAATTVWFYAERTYKGFASTPVNIKLADLKIQKAQSGAASAKRAANGARRKTQGDLAADSDCEEVQELSVPRCTLSKADLSKKYGPWFMWGQLMSWFKQTVYDPSATLSASRRGTISLPDIESCYVSKTRYNQKERGIVLDHIKHRPDAMWKSGTIFSFKNEAKVYGSPMFDAVYWKMYGGGTNPMEAVMQSLRNVQLPGGMA